MQKTPVRRAPRHVRAHFLQLLDATGSVRAAAAAAGVPRSTLYKWRSELPDFASDWRKALGQPPARPPEPPPAPAPDPEWIELPGQGPRHISTIIRPPRCP